MGFPKTGPTLEQSLILGEAMKFTKGRWPSKAIRGVWQAAWYGEFKKEGFIQNIAKKYKFKKFECLNPFLTKYILDILDEEIIPRIEYKSSQDLSNLGIYYWLIINVICSKR